MDYITLFITLLAFAIGLGAGILRQRAIDEAALDQLAAENRQLRKRLAVTLCRYRAKSQTVKWLQRHINRSSYPLRASNEVEEYLMRDRSHQ